MIRASERGSSGAGAVSVTFDMVRGRKGRPMTQANGSRGENKTLSKSLYDVLGVKKSASDEEIRKAYRKLAKELHPDLHPGDKAAENRFKEVSAAFNILGDKDKRARYDRGEIDETGAERPEHHFYRQYADSDAGHHYSSSAGFQDFADLGDIFSDLFGERGARGGPGMRVRGADTRYHLQVGFLEAANGAKKRITMPDGTTLDITIPRGVDDGQTIRLKGKGRPGANDGPPGDALIEIEVAPHPHFSRDGLNILLDLPITLDEAVLGAKIEVPTISGTVRMSVPKGASGGDTLRLKGRGIQDTAGKRKGDQLVRLQIAMPDKIDPELEEFIEKWRQAHAYNPRRRLGAAS